MIEKVRKDTELIDGLMWYCDDCNHLLHEYEFPLKNIERDFLSRFKEFYSSLDKRTCKNCSTVMEVDSRFVD